MAFSPTRPDVSPPTSRGGAIAPLKPQIAASGASPMAALVSPPKSVLSALAEADTAHGVPPDFDRALDTMIEKREAEKRGQPASSSPSPPPAAFLPPSAPPVASVQPPPPSTPPSRMPSRGAIVGGRSFSSPRPSSSSIPPVVTSLAPGSMRPPAGFDPLAVASTMQAAQATRYSAPPPTLHAAPRAHVPSYVPPTPPSAPVAYERAYRRWSQPQIDGAPAAQPLSYQVFTPDALPPAPLRVRLPSIAAFAPPPRRANMLLRAGAVMLGVAVVVGTGLAGRAVVGDDGPKAAAGVARPPAITTTTGFDLLPTTTTIATAPAAPAGAPGAEVVVMEDPPAAAPAALPAAKAAPKEKIAAGSASARAKSGSAALPPNPYDGR